jgi:hypothetical protein
MKLARWRKRNRKVISKIQDESVIQISHPAAKRIEYDAQIAGHLDPLKIIKPGTQHDIRN